MSIRKAFILPALVAMVFLALILTWMGNSSTSRIQKEQVEFLIAGRQSAADVAIQMTGVKAMQQASLFSATPEVIAAYESAGLGNMNDPSDPTLQEARVELRSYLTPYAAGFKASNNNKSLKLHFHLPSGLSFLRAWRKTQQLDGRDLSDDLSSFRQTVLDINSGKHLPVAGIEIGRGGFAVRGIAPITAPSGTHLGSVERLFGFDDITQQIKLTDDDDFAVFMNAEFLSVAKKLQDPEKNPRIGQFVLVSTSNKELCFDHVDESMLLAGSEGLSDVFHEGEHAFGTFPIFDYRGEQIGVMLASTNQHAALTAIAASKRSSLLISIGLLVIFIGILWYIGGNMARPIEELSKTARDLAESGGLDESLSVSQALLRQNNEVGQLSNAMQSMLDSIREAFKKQKSMEVYLDKSLERLLGLVQEVGSGKLNTEIKHDREDEIGNLYAGVNTMVVQMRGLITHLVEDAGSLSASASELSGISANMQENASETDRQVAEANDASSEVNDNVQSVATATEELSAAINEISRSAAQATQVASEAKDVVEDASSRITQLDRSSKEIGQVIQVINGIAEQTNLLALNATIEAARAGDAGKGFAVVAGEVKDLASETGKATDEIRQKIETIQRDTQASIESITRIHDIIAQIHDIEATIAASVEEQAATTSEIGQSLAIAAQASGRVNATIQDVQTVSQKTSSGATDSQDAAEQLSRLSQDLMGAVQQFEI
jgi:methyl-accepting chemotaxis protein